MSDLLFDGRRIGIFTVSRQFVEAGIIPEMFYKFGITPVRAESLYIGGDIEYTAISPHFEILEQGIATPYYKFIVHRDDENNETYEVKKEADR
jgi:hypothetical protein